MSHVANDAEGRVPPVCHESDSDAGPFPRRHPRLRCADHPDVEADSWGCPDCVRFLRRELQQMTAERDRWQGVAQGLAGSHAQLREELSRRAAPPAPVLADGDYDDAAPYWDQATRWLGARMSELSEDAVCASWEHQLEFHLWWLGHGGGEGGYYDAEAAARLVVLGKELGCWWTYRDEGPTRVPMAEWLAMYAAQTGWPVVAS